MCVSVCSTCFLLLSARSCGFIFGGRERACLSSAGSSGRERGGEVRENARERQEGTGTTQNNRNTDNGSIVEGRTPTLRPTSLGSRRRAALGPPPSQPSLQPPPSTTGGVARGRRRGRRAGRKGRRGGGRGARAHARPARQDACPPRVSKQVERYAGEMSEKMVGMGGQAGA
jgi:hypothetical protein